ncbi:MAG: Lrp/AsnC family transcriptional regulator [Peptococcaceae bacterium]|nr:MAG: Lrp/AsnC family transcriptional regulator [Peptococcaceae bacterium]
MLTELDKKIIRELQDGLPLVSRPFEVMAKKLGITGDELLTRVREFIDSGIIRRFGAAVRHQDLGYVANAVVMWRVPADRVEEVGRAMAGFAEISHCYLRSCPPEWRHSLFTVLHGLTREECVQAAARISRAVGLDDYQVVFSTAELKKSSMRYYE